MTEMTSDTPLEGDARTAETDTGVQNSDSSTETQAEDKPQISENAQKRINELTAEKYALKKQLAEKDKPVDAPKQEAIQPQAVNAPVLPDDIYDEDAMKKYHNDMISFSTAQAQEAAKSTYQQQQTEAEKAKQVQQQQQLIQDYAKRGLDDGLTIEQMQVNEQVLLGAGIGEQLGGFIMSDPNGAKLANHLANNQDELQKVLSMNPMQAAVYVANEVKLKAMGPSNVSKAPEPTETITSGLSASITDDFDSACPGAQFD